MNTNAPHGESNEPSRRGFLSSAAMAGGAAAMPFAVAAADPQDAPAATKKRKTFLAVQGHLDDALIGCGGVLIQAAKAGHRVVVVTVASDYSSWGATVGREERCKQEQIELGRIFGYETRFLDGKYHQTVGTDLELKKKLAEIYVELKPDAAFISHHEDHWPDHSGSGLAAKDAFLFSHGLSHDLKQYRCPLILAFKVTPHQTYHFEPDVFYDVTGVMPEYVDLIGRIEAIRTDRTFDQETKYEFRKLGREPRTMALTSHAVIRLAEALCWGSITGCEYAVGFKTVYGQRRGPQIV